MRAFWKYEALGNDYLVLDPAGWGDLPAAAGIRRLCDRHFGLGSDGILWGPLPAPAGALCGLRIFNPDGSEAEKSGNGLRIFARHLFDLGRVAAEAPFAVATAGGVAACCVLEGGRRVRVGMGRARFGSGEIPVTGPAREVLNETTLAGGEPVLFCGVTVGNPHCVVLNHPATEAVALRLGPALETHRCSRGARTCNSWRCWGQVRSGSKFGSAARGIPWPRAAAPVRRRRRRTGLGCAARRWPYTCPAVCWM